MPAATNISKRKNSEIIEAANRAEVTALLIRNGFRVYRPEADTDGEDLVIRTETGEFRVVQLKGRPTVDMQRYGGEKKIWMLFPDPQGDGAVGRDWFLISHEELYDWFNVKHANTASIERGLWSEKAISDDLRTFLEKNSTCLHSMNPKRSENLES